MVRLRWNTIIYIVYICRNSANDSLVLVVTPGSSARGNRRTVSTVVTYHQKIFPFQARKQAVSVVRVPGIALTTRRGSKAIVSSFTFFFS